MNRASARTFPCRAAGVAAQATAEAAGFNTTYVDAAATIPLRTMTKFKAQGFLYVGKQKLTTGPAFVPPHHVEGAAGCEAVAGPHRLAVCRTQTNSCAGACPASPIPFRAAPFACCGAAVQSHTPPARVLDPCWPCCLYLQGPIGQPSQPGHHHDDSWRASLCAVLSLCP